MWGIVDENGDGVLDYGEFTRSFIGSMSEFRKHFVRKVKLQFSPLCACSESKLLTYLLQQKNSDSEVI